jgi:hypothetical protein
MRLFLIVGFLMVCHLANAQVTPTIPGAPGGKTDSVAGKVVHICMPSKSALLQPPPLYIVKSRDKEFRVKSAKAMEFIEPNAIQTINVLRGDSITNKYGNEAKYGVIIITVKDDKYPDLYKQIKKASKEK